MRKVKEYLPNSLHIAGSKLVNFFTEYSSNCLHGLGSALSIASGIPSLPHNPGYVFNVAVGALLGYEALPHKEPKNYPPSSKYDALVGAVHGIISSRNVKMLFGGALTGMSIWFAIQGNSDAARDSALFDIGLWLSIGGSEIERRRLGKTLKEIVKEK